MFAVLSALFIFSTPSLAKVMVEDKGEVVIVKGETIDDDLFVGAESITIDGTVTGSVYAGSGRFSQNGTIKGDLVLGTGNAMISGNIGGDIYLGAGDATLNKVTVGGSIVAGVGNFTIDKESKIGGSLITGAGNLHNSAAITRSAMIGAGTIYLDSPVGKEARLGGGNITLGPSAKIAGDLIYALGEDSDELIQDPAATIAGTVSHYTPPADAKHNIAKAKEDMGKLGLVAHRGWLVISFISSLLIGFMLLKLLPKTSLGLSSEVSSNLMRSLGIGFLMIVFAAPVLLVLALTVIGLPLAGMLLLLLCVELHLAKLISSYALGRFVARQFNWNKLGVYATYFVGLAIFYFLRAVPGIGWVASFLFTWVGLGAIWSYTKSHQKSL